MRASAAACALSACDRARTGAYVSFHGAFAASYIGAFAACCIGTFVASYIGAFVASYIGTFAAPYIGAFADVSVVATAVPAHHQGFLAGYQCIGQRPACPLPRECRARTVMSRSPGFVRYSRASGDPIALHDIGLHTEAHSALRAVC